VDIYAKIDRDYISEGDETKRTGSTWSTKAKLEGEKVRFRMKDDDGNVYYGGWLINDPHGIVQYDMLRWGENDAGCTTIEVKIGDKWVQEIG
jgi:hypothetical protein